jgi:hypothetical protein
MATDDTLPLVDKVVEAVLHHQGIPFKHTSEYRNIYRYDQLWEQLEHYNPVKRSDRMDSYLRDGLKFAFSQFARPESLEVMKPVNLLGGASELIHDLKIRDTSSGLTSYGESKFEAFTVGLDKAVDILVNDKAPAPALAGVRTQRKGKTRLVWNIPLEMIIIEATVARRIIDNFKSREFVMTFGSTSHEIGSRLRKCASTYKYHVSIDYSQFDSSVRADIIHHAFNALRTWYDLSEEVYPGVTVAKVFDLVERYFACTPIVMPKRGSKYPVLVQGKTMGVPSGSYFTSIVDSFCNTALIGAASSKFSLGIGPNNLFVLGDDCLFFTNATTTLQQLQNFMATYGFKTNPTKGSVGMSTDRIEYLGRTWRNGFPLRGYSDVIRGALYPEKYRRYPLLRGLKEEQVLGLLNSYRLTSYVEDAPESFSRVSNVSIVPSHMTSGFIKFLMSEGFVPGKGITRAIY